jgi:competence CoiA-like predicted nuclease
MKHQPALLQWVLIDDEMQHVSSYAHLKPKQRPEAICPVCQKPVITKLGSQKVHHVAHKPGSDCVLTNPESALHFNCKMHIARQLEKNNSIKLTEKCTSCYTNKREIVWQEDWDEVRVERKVSDGLQPDVALWKNNQPLAAIEIFVTHAVDHEKSSRLKALGIPWIEIKGQSSLYLEDSAWQVDIPMPADKTSWKTKWQCLSCEEAARQKLERLEWQRLNGEKPFYFKLIDWFFPHGSWLRCLFTINSVLKDGQIVEFNLSYVKTSMNYERIKFFEENCYKVKSISANYSEQEAVEILQKAGKAYLRRKRKQHNLIFDSPMPWIKGEPGYFEGFNNFDFPRRQFFNKKTKQWFIPKDKKDEVWYRVDGTEINRERDYWHRG